jgi:superfamily II DNA or RNA helicase
MAFSLRDYQEDAVVSVRMEFRQGKRYVLIVLATGAGKTVIFSYIARSAAEKGSKVLILAHRDQLIKQASHKLRDYDVAHGIIMPGFTPNLRARVQVGSIQTVVRRMAKMSFVPDLIVIDEAHLSAAATYRKIMDFYPKARVLGVTGSPCRLDNKPLGRVAGGIYDAMVQGISISQLIDRGFLVRPVVYAPANRLDLSGVRKTAGDYNTQDLAAALDKPTITGDAVKMYRKICDGVPAVAWCVSIGHATNVAAEFNAAGVPAIMLCGEHDSDYRDKALKALETGQIKVITFVGILIEGVDCPAIGAILLLRPTMSLSSYLQVIGRGLRIYTDPFGNVKTCCYVLDHCGLTFKHGLADEDREWSLEDGEVKAPGQKKARDADRVDIAQCLGCFGMFAPAPMCPHCGKVVEAKQRKIEVEDGVLERITPEMIAAMKRQKQKEVRTARSLPELEKIAAERGYSAGWARNAWEAKQRTRDKYRKRPPEPSLTELEAMTLTQLEAVAAQQGWPLSWPSEFFYDTHSKASGGN